jgi:hypothetical protein
VVDNGDATFTASCDNGQDTAGNHASAIATYTVVPAVYGAATNTKAISGNNAITATITTTPIPAGHTITVAVATGTFAGAVGCADNRGNTYTVVADRNTGNGRLFVCSATAATTLTAGDTVTATYPGFSGLSVISVNAISDAVSTGTVGQTVTSAGNNAAPNSGSVTTTHPYEAVFGVIAHNSTPVLTLGAGYTTVGAVSGGSGSGMRTLTPMFRLAATPGTYAAAGTLSAGQQWRAVAVTYSPA